MGSERNEMYAAILMAVIDQAERRDAEKKEWSRLLEENINKGYEEVDGAGAFNSIIFSFKSLDHSLLSASSARSITAINIAISKKSSTYMFPLATSIFIFIIVNDLARFDFSQINE